MEGGSNRGGPHIAPTPVLLPVWVVVVVAAKQLVWVRVWVVAAEEVPVAAIWNAKCNKNTQCCSASHRAYM